MEPTNATFRRVLTAAIAWSLLFSQTLGLVFMPRAEAQGTFVNQVKLSAKDGNDEDYLGAAVAASENFLAVGAPYDWDGQVVGTGSVYLFKNTDFLWQEVQKLQPSDGASEDEFGLALAMQGDRLVVGAPGHAQRRGAVYIFELQNGVWTPIQKILAADGSNGNAFGAAVSLDGDRLVVGAPAVSSSRGAAYIFTRNGSSWLQIQRIVASDASSGDSFGSVVALKADQLSIGARLDDHLVAGDNRGSVYIFDFVGNGFTGATKVLLADGRAGDQFGSTLAFLGSDLLVGAPFRDAGAGDDNSGTVFHYGRGSGAWALQGTLQDPQAVPAAGFGSSIAVRDTTAIIGAPFGNNTAGFAVHFEFEQSWVVQGRMVAADARPFEYYGKSVALSEEHAVIGAELANVGDQVEQGAVYAEVRAKTQTSVIVSPNPSLVGIPIDVEVGVSSDLITPEGTVRIRSTDGSECVISITGGAGECRLPGQPLGINTITASFNGGVGLSASSDSSSLAVVPALAFTTTDLPKGKIGRMYDQRLEASQGGATDPLNFVLTSGNLPDGIELFSDGRVSGVALEAGTFNFRASVVDSSPAELGGPFVAVRDFSIEVDPAYSTVLMLGAEETSGFRGQIFRVSSHLGVVEPEAGPPTGIYQVVAQLGDEMISCSTAVSAEGVQECDLHFELSDPEGLYTVAASFIPDQADYGRSRASTTHSLFREVDLMIDISSGQTNYRPGQQVGYLVTVQNLGPDQANMAAIQVQPSSSLSELAWTCSGLACPSLAGTGPIDFSANLASDESIRMVLLGRVAPFTTKPIEALASVGVTQASFQQDPATENNAASHVMTALSVFSDGFE